MKRLWLLYPLSLLALSACQPVLIGAGIVAADQIINEEDPNFAAQNYAVADFLIQQADTFIGPNDLITTEPLTDIQSPEISTTIAKLIPEQIGIRLSQLGYRMDLSEVTTSNDTSYLRPALNKNEKPDFIITGNYLRKTKRDVDVKTRIIDLKSNRIVAVFDYSMTMTRGVRELSTPQPRIIRTTKQ
ncbi:MAG: FlgO family outer membrane protein [Bdellovibrionales bacterium]